MAAAIWIQLKWHHGWTSWPYILDLGTLPVIHHLKARTLPIFGTNGLRAPSRNKVSTITGVFSLSLGYFYCRLLTFFCWRSSSFETFVKLFVVLLVWVYFWKDITIAEIFLYLYVMASSIRGCLHLKQSQCLVWSLKLKFQIWWRSGQWLLRYSTFYIWVCLLLKIVFHWRSSSFKMSVMFGLVT
jgi:hypothetical protein